MGDPGDPGAECPPGSAGHRAVVKEGTWPSQLFIRAQKGAHGCSDGSLGPFLEAPVGYGDRWRWFGVLQLSAGRWAGQAWEGGACRRVWLIWGPGR